MYRNVSLQLPTSDWPNALQVLFWWCVLAVIVVAVHHRLRRRGNAQDGEVVQPVEPGEVILTNPCPQCSYPVVRIYRGGEIKAEWCQPCEEKWADLVETFKKDGVEQ